MPNIDCIKEASEEIRNNTNRGEAVPQGDSSIKIVEQIAGEGKGVLFRPHRNTLAKAMSEVRTFKSRAELISFLNDDLKQNYLRPSAIDEADFRIEPYCYDERIGWDTYIVYEEGYGVFGFTNGPLL
jgi:hypothetical protein